MLGIIGVDDRAERLTFLERLHDVEQHPAATRRERLDVAVRHLDVLVAGEAPEGVGHLPRRVVRMPEHRRLASQERELLVRNAVEPPIGARDVDVAELHSCPPDLPRAGPSYTAIDQSLSEIPAELHGAVDRPGRARSGTPSPRGGRSSRCRSSGA